MIVLIIGHFLTTAKFREILQQYQNSAEKGIFHGSPRNSVGPSDEVLGSAHCKMNIIRALQNYNYW